MLMQLAAYHTAPLPVPASAFVSRRRRIQKTALQLRDLRGNPGLSDATFLINLSNESHLPCAAVPHNNDFVIAFTKLDETLPRTDCCFIGEAIAFVIAAVRNVDFSHQNSLLVLTRYSRGPCTAAGKFLIPFSEQAWQLGDVARYASSFIERQPLAGFSIALVGMTVHTGQGLSVGVNDLEARVYGFNGPWCWEASHGSEKGASLRSHLSSQMMP